jgi:hypothetical protein
MVELAARQLVYLAIVPLILSTATLARAASGLLDDPPETNVPAAALPAASIAQSFPVIVPSPAELPASTAAQGPAKRPAALLPLYVSFTALQFADVHATLRALDAGGREGNPVFAGLRSPAGMLAVKAGLALGTTYAVERLRKKSPRTAVVLMIALNSAYAGIVAHNYAVARQR